MSTHCNEDEDEDESYGWDGIVVKKLRIESVLFILIITGLGIANLLHFNKPEISELENRALKRKPQFSMTELFSGSYLESFEEYYSDTFILRDDLVKTNRDLRQAIEFLGPDVTLITAYDDIQGLDEMGGEWQNNAAGQAESAAAGNTSGGNAAEGNAVVVGSGYEAGGNGSDGTSGSNLQGGSSTSGSNMQNNADSTSGNASVNNADSTSGNATGSNAGNGKSAYSGAMSGDTYTSEQAGSSIAGSSTSASGGAEDLYSREEAIRDFGDGQDVGYWLVVDGKAVQLFKFNKESFEYYAQILNKYSERLGSGVRVYSMIPPTNSEFVQLKRYKGITDSQDDALGFLKSKLDRRISSINVYDALNKHKDEYIFFRTDHHWTALGAYYAYEAFMETKKESAVPLERYEELDLGEFLGSSYTKTLNKSLEKNPDQVVAYKPFTSNEYLMYYGNTEKKAEVIDLQYTDKITNKYLTFMSTGGGTWSVIKTDVHNGRKIVVIKDSFGNAFVPFLLPHYEEIYVVDARFYSIKATGRNIVEFIEDNKIDEVLFLIYMEDVNWHKFMTGVENLLGIEEVAGSAE